MSVNESISEQPEDIHDLPDLYNRELLRKKNAYVNPVDCDVSNPNSNSGGGGYREWKAKNCFDNSERMVSSLGRALHSQGIVTQNGSNFYENNTFHDDRANVIQDHHSPRLNSSEPCYTPHQPRFKHNQEPYKPEIYSHGDTDCRKYYQHSNERSNMQEYSPEMQFNTRCMDQCCNQNKSPRNSPKNHSTSISQRMPNHASNSHHYFIEPQESVPINGPPCHGPQFNHNFMPQHNQFRQCHLQPSSCHCCPNPNELPHRKISPHKKSTSSKKNDSSIKKLFRILWLQNEQLGLLEKQVSKLIELSFSKDSAPEGKLEKEKPNKLEMNDIAIMTDLPCIKCMNNEKKISSSESEPEAIKKPSRKSGNESLTLHEVDIPVSSEEVSSPPVSMHIDLHEFQSSSSSSETEESDTTEDESEPVGWTFYDNVVGQVNNILKTANKKKKKRNVHNNEVNIEQMRKLGLGGVVQDYDSNNPKRVTFNEGLKEPQMNLRAQSEISMNFNALASKYLTSGGAKVQDISMCNVISGNTNMSLATMRYLERHQIATRDVENISKKATSSKKRKSLKNGEKDITSKFLDITAIRQQPKLLPKDI